MKKIYIVFLFFSLLAFLSFKTVKINGNENKPTICILGGTPSTAGIVNEIPDEIKEKYNIISFNRPGFGGTANGVMSREKLFELAKKAGLKKNDFGIIGVSGGGPLAILIASEFNLSHCGVISGMVSREAYFPFADSTFTKPLMSSIVSGYDSFKTTVESFPNVDQIFKQAGSPRDIALRACYDDLNFILLPSLFTKEEFNKVNITWRHGENDKNVALESVELFLRDFKKAELSIIPNASHAIDARVQVAYIIRNWEVVGH